MPGLSSRTQLRILLTLAAQFPTDADVLWDLSRAYTERAYLLLNLAGPDAADGDYRRSAELREQLVQAHPTDSLYRRYLVNAYANAARSAIRLRQMEAARAYYEKARTVAAADAADPQNLQALGNYGSLLLNIGTFERVLAGKPRRMTTCAAP